MPSLTEPSSVASDSSSSSPPCASSSVMVRVYLPSNWGSGQMTFSSKGDLLLSSLRDRCLRKIVNERLQNNGAVPPTADTLAFSTLSDDNMKDGSKSKLLVAMDKPIGNLCSPHTMKAQFTTPPGSSKHGGLAGSGGFLELHLVW